MLDLADEIAYNTADLDDAFSAGLFSMEAISQQVHFFGELAEQIDTQFPGASERIRFWEVQRQVMNFLIGGLIEGSRAAVDAAGVQTVADVRAFGQRLASFTPRAKQVNEELRAFLLARLYSHPDLESERVSVARQLGELFAFLIEHPDRVSAGYRERLKEDPAERVVCDYVAGMTDAYFQKVYRELLGA